MRLAMVPVLAVSATVAAGLVGSLDARAQSAEAAQSEGLEEVTVSARRREESLQDVPIAVTAYSADSLESIGAIDITALQQTAPNLTLQTARGSNSTLIAFIRGVGQQDPLWGFEPGVGLYVDDVYVARPQGAVLDIFDIQRVEVLRGPQGTLYGRNTIGGAIKYVTARIGETPRLDAKVNLGSFSQRDVILAGSTPIAGGFALGGAVALYRRDGFGTNLVTGAEHYNKDVDAFRLSAEWQPREDVFLRLSGDLVRDKSNARHGHREAPGSGLATGEAVLRNVFDTRAGIGDRNEVENKGVSLLAQWDINEQWTFKSITAWREGDTNTVIDFDTGPTAALDVPAYYDDNQTSQELQILYDGGRLRAVAGAYWFDGYAAGAFDTVLGIANLAIATQGSVDTTSIAAFANVEYDLTDQWTIEVGGRYTKDDKDGSVYRQNFTGARSPLFGGRTSIPGLLRTRYSNSREFSDFSPRFSLRFEPSDELTLYASLSQGFKSGGFDMRGDVVFFPATTAGYDSETVDTYELGGKASLLDRRLSVAAAVFRSDYKDQQITSQLALPTVPPTIVSFVDNVGASTIQGAELELNARVNSFVSGNLTLGYIDAEFDEFVTFDPATNTRRNLAAQRAFQNTPELVGSLSLTLGATLANGSAISLVPKLSHRSKYQLFEVPIPLLDQDAYTLVDVSVNWTSSDGKLRLGLHGRNLTDEEYRIGGYNFPGATFGNSVNGFYGPPRTFTVSASYRFE